MIHELDNVHTTRLVNGALVITETLPGVETAAVGVWTDAGSIDETPGEYGQAHFLEHMLFKGTDTLSPFAISEAIESIGGHLNAYTERDTTTLFARTLADHLPKVVTLLAEMICHSTFPQEELHRERQVIIEEIRKYEAVPEDRIHDLLFEALWHGGSLGHPILGTEESIRSLSRDQIVDCWRCHFASYRVIITASGKVEHTQFVELCANAFASLPVMVKTVPIMVPGDRLPLRVIEEDEDQVVFCWGGRTYPAHDERNFALTLVDAVLGASTTSRLFQSIREQRGLAYDVSSYTMGFRETGAMVATGATSTETFPEVLSLMQREIAQLRTHGMTTAELLRAKEQMKAGLALALETTSDRMRRLAQHYMTWGTIYSISYLIDRLQQVTPEEIQHVIEEVLDPTQWSFVAIGPVTTDEMTSLLGNGG